MLRRILVGLDPSEHSRTAVRAACHYARLVDSLVIGIGVVDEHAIRRSEHGAPIGASYYAVKSVEHRLEKARETLDRLVAGFQVSCSSLGVRHEFVIRTGTPAEEILAVANGVDIFVSGNRTFFEFATREDADDTIREGLRAHVVPVLALPAGVEPPFRRAVIACDGSPSSIRALRSFAYQTWDRPFHPDVILVWVGDDAEEGERELEPPRRFLEAYGFAVEARLESGDATAKLREVVTAEPPSLLVLGSRGRWAPLDVLLGGTTRKFFEDGTVPLLIAS